MADKEAVLDKAVTDAVEKVGGGDPPEDKGTADIADVTIDKEEEEEEDSTSDTSDEETDDLNEDQRKESLRLYKALLNPKTAGPIVAALAAQAGLTLQPHQTKQETKQNVKSIKEVVAEKLGEKYKFLATEIGDAIEGALQVHSEVMDTKLAEISERQVEREVVAAYEKLARETKGESKKLEARMAALAEEIPIGTKMNVETYIRRLFVVATAETQKSSAKQTADKIRRNAGDVPGRLRGTGANAQEAKIPDKKMNLTEAVNYAIEQAVQGKK